MIELKSCPFCGGKAKMKSSVTLYAPHKPTAYVYCEKCRATGEVFEDTQNNGEHIFMAIEAWNRRVADEVF